ncbi:MAG: hypothetical protein KF880_01450 [Ferruginibacter sp.]|nr:hypothetical protein [Ferruginibacter sp.]
MNIFKLALQLFLLYILYKFIFHFVIPVYRNTKIMSRKMREMQERMDQQRQGPAPEQPVQKKPAPTGEYIDYEEIK